MPSYVMNFQKGTPVRPATKVGHGPQPPARRRAAMMNFGAVLRETSRSCAATLSLEIVASQARLQELLAVHLAGAKK